MKTLTQEELLLLRVGDIVEIRVSKQSGFLKDGWIPAVVIPSTYYGCVMVYTINKSSKSNREKMMESYDCHRAWIGRMRPDLIRKTNRMFRWSYRALS